MDQGGGVLELHSQDLKMPHTMIMQDFGKGEYKLSVICLIVSNNFCLKMEYRNTFKLMSYILDVYIHV